MNSLKLFLFIFLSVFTIQAEAARRVIGWPDCDKRHTVSNLQYDIDIKYKCASGLLDSKSEEQCKAAGYSVCLEKADPPFRAARQFCGDSKERYTRFRESVTQFRKCGGIFDKEPLGSFDDLVRHSRDTAADFKPIFQGMKCVKEGANYNCIKTTPNFGR